MWVVKCNDLGALSQATGIIMLSLAQIFRVNGVRMPLSASGYHILDGWTGYPKQDEEPENVGLEDLPYIRIM